MSNLKARPCDEVAIRASRGEPACAKQYQGWVLAAAVLIQRETEDVAATAKLVPVIQ